MLQKLRNSSSFKKRDVYRTRLFSGSFFPSFNGDHYFVYPSPENLFGSADLWIPLNGVHPMNMRTGEDKHIEDAIQEYIAEKATRVGLPLACHPGADHGDLIAVRLNLRHLRLVGSNGDFWSGGQLDLGPMFIAESDHPDFSSEVGLRVYCGIAIACGRLTQMLREDVILRYERGQWYRIPHLKRYDFLRGLSQHQLRDGYVVTIQGDKTEYYQVERYGVLCAVVNVKWDVVAIITVRAALLGLFPGGGFRNFVRVNRPPNSPDVTSIAMRCCRILARAVGLPRSNFSTEEIRGLRVQLPVGFMEETDWRSELTRHEEEEQPTAAVPGPAQSETEDEGESPDTSTPPVTTTGSESDLAGAEMTPSLNFGRRSEFNGRRRRRRRRRPKSQSLRKFLKNQTEE